MAYAHVIDLDGRPATPDAERPPPVVRPAPAPKPPPTPGTGSSRYLASKGGKVFHMPDCSAAKRIVKKNLIVYRSRAEAAKEKRPAEDCNP